MTRMKKIAAAAVLLAVAGSAALSGLAQETEQETAVMAETEQEQETGIGTETDGQQEDQPGGSGQVASKDEMVEPEDIVTDDMVPVYADSLNEGTYPIDVLSSSSMFRIIEAQLTVADGEMRAVITLNGDGYLKLFMGTGEEAAAAAEEDYITFEPNEEGRQTYEVPVEALDMGIDCTAFSRKKEKWYDRVLVFSAASLPQEAFADSVLVTAQDLGLEDGAYTVEVTLEGGSGKTTVDSPAALAVTDGAAEATIVFSSPYYDYVLADGEKYLPVNTEGNSTFEIPVSAFDFKMPVTADTIAMSTPHEIDYTLYFDSKTIEKAE